MHMTHGIAHMQSPYVPETPGKSPVIPEETPVTPTPEIPEEPSPPQTPPDALDVRIPL
jgi:hypothetical protein